MLHLRSTTQDLERRTHYGLELRGDDNSPLISGYFSPFNSLSEKLGFFKERMLPGAFASSLRAGNDILALYHHDPKLVLGSTRAGSFKLREDAQGLYGEISPPDTTTARDVVANMKAGNIRGASIGFRDVKGGFKWIQGGEDGVDIREVSNLQLIEGTITAIPAYKATALAARTLLPEGIDDDRASLILRALNRIENSLDVVDEDREVLREYRSQLQEHRALVDKLLGPVKQYALPGDILRMVEAETYLLEVTMSDEERANVKKKGNSMPYGDVDYADPGYQSDKKKRYPLNNAEHIKAAWDYIHHGNDKDKYTASQVKHIEDAIIAAWKEKIDPKGPPSANDDDDDS